MKLHYSIWNNISLFLDAKYIFEFRRICKATSYTQITNLYDLDYQILKKLNNDIIKNYPFCEKLNDRDRRTDDECIKHLTNLIQLNASYNSYITDKGISHMKLHTLDARYNYNITNKGIKYMNLHELRGH